jgi:hypothetical protein
MRLSISVAAGAALCVAAAASGGFPGTQTFTTNLLGGFIIDGSERSPYISAKYGKSFGYLHKLPADVNRSYEPWQLPASTITNAEFKLTIDLGAETGFDLPISFHVMFYTGADSSPVKQFEILQKLSVRTDANTGVYTYTKKWEQFTAAERTMLASGAGTPNGTFFLEVFSSFSFQGTARAELTIIPGPGGALAMTIFAMGGLARRRRAG